MYAAYNTALGYEMQDSIDTALEWALKAQTLAREKSKTDKKRQAKYTMEPSPIISLSACM